MRGVLAVGGDGGRSDPGDPGRDAAGLGPGSRVAGYLLEEQVGSGGIAVVFRATDERLGRRAAVKVLASWVAADPVFRGRFLREARAAAKVDDPHIIPVYEAGESDGVLFLAMRYVPGPDVRTLLADQRPLLPGGGVVTDRWSSQEKFQPENGAARPSASAHQRRASRLASHIADAAVSLEEPLENA